MTPEEIAKMVSEDVNAPINEAIDAEVAKLFESIRWNNLRIQEDWKAGAFDDLNFLTRIQNMKAAVLQLEKQAKALVPKRGGPPQPKSGAKPKQPGRYSQMGPGEGFK